MTKSGSWTLLTAAGGIIGFDASAFGVDASASQNAFQGFFNISQNGNSLELNYLATAVPEPSSLLIGGTLLLIGFGRRQRRQI